MSWLESWRMNDRELRINAYLEKETARAAAEQHDR